MFQIPYKINDNGKRGHKMVWGSSHSTKPLSIYKNNSQKLPHFNLYRKMVPVIGAGSKGWWHGKSKSTVLVLRKDGFCIKCHRQPEYGNEG